MVLSSIHFILLTRENVKSIVAQMFGGSRKQKVKIILGQTISGTFPSRIIFVFFPHIAYFAKRIIGFWTHVVASPELFFLIVPIWALCQILTPDNARMLNVIAAVMIS
jgi:hypothetical protein